MPKIQAFLIETQSKAGLKINKKGPIDLVTEADLGSEKMVIEEIRRFFPDDHIMGEEGTNYEGKNQYRWVIDPVDGTTNYAHRLPLYGICLGLENLEAKKRENAQIFLLCLVPSFPIWFFGLSMSLLYNFGHILVNLLFYRRD